MVRAHPARFDILSFVPFQAVHATASVHIATTPSSPSMAANIPLPSIAAALFTGAALWLGWRLWKFKLFPALHPNEAKQMPYSVPCIPPSNLHFLV